MRNAPDTNPKHVIRRGPRDFDALLHGQSIGSFPSELQAWADVNCVSLAQCRYSVAPETAVSERDEPAHTAATTDDESPSLPTPAADLTVAATRLRPDPAIQKALKRLLDGGWSYTDGDDGLVVRFDPRSKGKGKRPSSSYTTKQDSCTCPGAIIRGACYHPIAWQIVNEALTPTTTIQCHVPAAMFLPLCLLALAGGTERVTFTATSACGTLTLGTDDLATGTIRVEMLTPVLLTIALQVRAIDLKRLVDGLADAIAPDTDILTLDLNAESVLVMAGSDAAPSFFDGLDAAPVPSTTTDPA